MIIRPMAAEEIDLVIMFFQYYREAAGVDPDRYDHNRLIDTIREYNIRSNLFFRVAMMGTRPVGVIGGFLSQDPVESEVAATIQFCYLLDEHSDIDNYDRLISEFQEWAKTCGATVIRAIDIGTNIKRLNHIYQELDFDPVMITVMNKEL